ncbi:MAG: LysR family transcriptional regulator [Ruminococcaceae bacterium]|nr:LysR family transcriptional regulator [Oscillospiraceae bacterium]
MLDNVSKYVYEVYRCKSVSAAAKKLYISQPALSSSIKKAEEELGAPIFNRETLPFTLTPEGKVYIEAIERILVIEEEMHENIMGISTMNSGKITVGTATHLSSYAIPKICERFQEKYPKIDINIIWSTTKELPNLLEEKNVDLIFTSSDMKENNFVVEPLFEERCIIVIKRDHEGIEHLLPYAISYEEMINKSYSKGKAISDMMLFSGIEFVYAPPNSNLYKKRKLFFGESSLSKHITSNTGSYRLNYNLMLAGFGALFTTDSALAITPPSEDCLYFAIDSPEAKQEFSIIHNVSSDSASRRIIDRFVECAKELFSDGRLAEIFQ